LFSRICQDAGACILSTLKMSKCWSITFWAHSGISIPDVFKSWCSNRQNGQIFKSVAI